ncbi:DUF3794 domain-containing protein [Clostridiaceae bacterium NSJ-31]|uniref:DUF3794 domain-containing protein n=3 Tax=Ligaoa zhengdingensis TaxID=2763658 RepID=A0A926DWH2_9FIRM|nr:SPOCS domain-containing protein [Ligaoa zhengdingensis]MBC8546550.1 DUF3794 domain-containing protein [Ligaoa zhengdingensis]
MELKVIKESIALNEVVYDSFTELPIECDVLLPDYCPDIMKVLKCCATPVFTQTTTEGSSLTVEGYALLELYYLSDSMKIRCSEHKMPFSRVLDLKTTPENPAVSVSATVDYLNCRAVNQRRVDIRGAMTLSVKVIGQKNENVVCDAQGGGIQLRREAIDTTRVEGCADRQFTVREDLELGYGKPALGAIVRKQAQAVVTDCKVISNKVVIKGELMIDLFYLSEEDEKPETMSYNLPVSQIIDLPGVDEDCRCDVRLRVLSCDIQPKADLDGETTMLSAEVTLCACAKAYRATRVSAVSDAYSTTHEASYADRTVTALRLIELVDDRHTYKEQLELPDEVSSVLHLWCDAAFTGGKLEEKAAVLDGRLTLCMFALDSEGSPVYFEKPVEFSHHVELTGDENNLLADIAMRALTCEFTPTGGGIEVRAEISICGALYSVVQCTVMGELAVDENKPRQQDGSAALTIYFAQPGENVWDIAKRYHTSMAAVMEENAIEKEQLRDRATLLIPLVV